MQARYDFQQNYKLASQGFKKRIEHNLRYDITYGNNQYISVVLTDYVHTDGAQGMTT